MHHVSVGDRIFYFLIAVPYEYSPSQQLTWGDSLLSGWGPFEVIDMCVALGIEPIITLAYDSNGWFRSPFEINLLRA
jgi:hypothetical protein